jgi:hypothetical protein
MISIEQLIKIILGILVFSIVVFGIYLFFKNYVIDFFKNLGGNKAPQIIFGLLK